MVVKPNDETNRFTFKYSVIGELDQKLPLWQYLTEGEGPGVWVGVGVAIFAFLTLIFCVGRYFAKRQPLRKNKNLQLDKIQSEKLKNELELKLGTIAEENQPEDPTKVGLMAPGDDIGDTKLKEEGMVDLFYGSADVPLAPGGGRAILDPT